MEDGTCIIDTVAVYDEVLCIVAVMVRNEVPFASTVESTTTGRATREQWSRLQGETIVSDPS